jgi:hypothetical protein
MTLLMAVSLLVVLSGSAEAARRPASVRIASLAAGTAPAVSGGSFTVIDLLKLWKSGYRGYIKL